MYAAGRRMTFVSVPGLMDLSTVLSLNSRLAMCIPLSHIFSTVLSHFSRAPEMHIEVSSVLRSTGPWTASVPTLPFLLEELGKQVGCTVLLKLCLKFSAGGFHHLEHVSQVERQAHLSVWQYA